MHKQYKNFPFQFVPPFSLKAGTPPAQYHFLLIKYYSLSVSLMLLIHFIEKYLLKWLGWPTKGEINSNTIIVGDFNTPLTSMDRSSKQKISKETQALNIERAFHLKQQNTHSSQVHIEHSPGLITCHKMSLGKFKKLEIISSIFSNHNTTLWDYKSTTRKKL